MSFVNGRDAIPFAAKRASGKGVCTGSFVLRRLSAFSLIELLVVIAVTAILASIVMGAVSAARSASGKAHNVSNLKSLINGWQLYAADNDGNFPLGLTWVGGSNVINPPAINQLNYRYWWRWYGGIASYMPTLVVQDTEAAKNFNGLAAPDWGVVWQGWFPPGRLEQARELGNVHVGYHFNRYMGDHRRIWQGNMQNPARTPVLFAYWDEDSPSPVGQYFSSPVAGDPSSGNFMRVAAGAMGGGNHFAFADGHVEWVPAMSSAKEYEEQMRWQP